MNAEIDVPRSLRPLFRRMGRAGGFIPAVLGIVLAGLSPSVNPRVRSWLSPFVIGFFSVLCLVSFLRLLEAVGARRKNGMKLPGAEKKAFARGKKQRDAALHMLVASVLALAAAGALVAINVHLARRQHGEPGIPTAVMLALVVVWLVSDQYAIGRSSTAQLPRLLTFLGLKEEFGRTGDTFLAGVSKRIFRKDGDLRTNPVLAWGALGIFVCSVLVAAGEPTGTPKPPEEPTQDEPGSTDGEPEEPEAIAAAASSLPPPSPSPTEAAESELTALAFCGYEPEPVLRTNLPPVVGDGLWAAWKDPGADVIGCPDTGVERLGGLFLARLVRGAYNTIVVSDAQGQAAVVWEPLDDIALMKIEAGKLSRVAPRTSTGLGEYQVLFLTGGSCQLALRASYRFGYLLLEPSITRAVLAVSIARSALPTAIAQSALPDGVHYQLILEPVDGASPLETIEIVQENTGEVVVTPHVDPDTGTKATCAAVPFFDSLAARLADRINREVAEGREPRVP